MPKNSFLDTRFNSTPSGWSEEATFFNWLRHYLVPAVKEVKKLILQSMNEYRSYLSTHIIEHAMDNNIRLECLSLHTTTILQPPDVAILSMIKKYWRNLLSKHFKQNDSVPLIKGKFALLLSSIISL